MEMKVVAVSGVNGAGKTTFIERLRQSLINQGRVVLVMKAPDYDTPSGLKIRKFLMG